MINDIVRIKLPFGYMRIHDEASVTMEVCVALKTIFNFSDADVRINRRPDNQIDINFSFEGVPEARGGKLDYVDNLQISQDDTFRLHFGRSIYLEKIECDGIVVQFSKKYNNTRLDLL